MSHSPTPFLRRLVLPAALLALAAGAQAGVLPATGWNEFANGDLTGNNLQPTFVGLLAGGVTEVRGVTGRAIAGGPVDLDYFTFTVPAGFELSAMTLLEGTVPLINVGFVGLMAGNSFTVPPTTQSAEGLLGISLYSTNEIGTDLLPVMGIPTLGSTGFTPPLPAGSYSFWVQETGIGEAPYGFGFAVTPVPEPATMLTMLAGLALLGAALKRR